MNNYFSFILLLVLAACGSSESTEVQGDQGFTKAEEALLDRVQQETFNYYWEGYEPASNAAKERIHFDGNYKHAEDIVTTGATGFAIMATIAGVKRSFVTREAAATRLLGLVEWLEKADRFHGAWPHWLTPDGKAYPFSTFDDGGDLVETAFLIQGMLTAKGYFDADNPTEQKLRDKIEKLWREVEWDWYTQGKDEGLYWHWSPNHGWKMDFLVGGHNECLIMYALAASSPTHPVDPAVFHNGYMRGGKTAEGTEYLGYNTILNHYENNQMAVGPLFWTHYSHLGLDPRNLKSEYGDFWKLNVNHVKIVHKHCSDNPYEYRGYSDKCWGLTSSYSVDGYRGHNPQEDFGVISPTAALSSFPYLPKESMKFLKFMYEEQDSLIGKYGPYDAFNLQVNWHVPRYLGIDQLTIPVMIENHRSGLLWDTFMKNKDVQNGLTKLGFTY